ncbi:MAG: septum formation initiator family protein [Spirochaetales bacterium]|nr:septum formation initiator family protein [Spirochaetales bacterium]MCF7938218.1 septum formation initiator family protein [Spirochaetales bacterium]
MMRTYRIITAVSCGFLLYGLLMFLGGDRGLLAYRQLETYRGQLEENVENLKDSEYDLAMDLERLSRDPERVRLEARSLGYFERDEQPVRLQSYEQGSESYTIGSIIRFEQKKNSLMPVFRAIGISFGVGVYIILLLFGKGKTGYASARR